MPAKEYISVEPLSERLASFEYSLLSATVSKADARAAARRRALQRRFNDDLGSLDDGALAGIASAEAAWREKAAKVMAEAQVARRDVRGLAVRQGGGVEAPTVADGKRAQRAKAEHSKLLRRAKVRLADALE